MSPHTRHVICMMTPSDSGVPWVWQCTPVYDTSQWWCYPMLHDCSLWLLPPPSCFLLTHTTCRVMIGPHPLCFCSPFHVVFSNWFLMFNKQGANEATVAVWSQATGVLHVCLKWHLTSPLASSEHFSYFFRSCWYHSYFFTPVYYSPLPFFYIWSGLVDIIDHVEYGVRDRLYIFPMCGIFYLPWHKHQIEGTNSCHYLFQKTQTMWGKQTCPSFEAALQPVSYHTPLVRETQSNVESQYI